MLTRLAASRERLLIRNVRVLDVEKAELRPVSNVLIEKGIIKDINAPDSAPGGSIDLEGLTLSPGLIDCHCHILSPYLTEQKGVPGLWTFKQMDRNSIATLAAGIVCVRDMLSPIKIMNRLRGRIASGKIPGPDILASGGIFSCEGGYPEAVKQVPGIAAGAIGQPKYNPTTPLEAAMIVRYLKVKGANLIKVGYTRLSRKLVDGRTLPAIADDVLRGLCKAAHENGLKVSVHHNWSEDMIHLLEFDIDTLEHGVYDRNMLPEEVQAVVKKGITIVPTLTINDSQARFEEKIGFIKSERAKDFFEPQALAHLTWVCETWTSFSGESYDGSFGYTRANRYCYDTEERNTRNLFAAGVPMLAGTDFGAAVAFPGELADELLRLVNIGMTPLQAVRSATIEAANFVGRFDLGAAAPGRKADLVVIDGNPLEDIAAYHRVRYVGKSGSWYKTKYPELPDFWEGFPVLYQGD
ncbi:MAG: amidohydrolase family protein [bacterium]